MLVHSLEGGDVGPRVVITQWIHPHIVDLLSRSLEVVPNMTGKSLSREELLRRAQDAQGIMAYLPTDVIDQFVSTGALIS